MNIAFPSSIAYTYTSYAAEKVIQHAKVCLNRTYAFIQTQPGAYIAVIGVNLVAFNIALVMCRFVNCIFCKNEENTEQQRQNWCFTLLFTTIVGSSVYACHRQMGLPLTAWKVVGVSLVTNFIYLCCKIR